MGLKFSTSLGEGKIEEDDRENYFLEKVAAHHAEAGESVIQFDSAEIFKRYVLP